MTFLLNSIRWAKQESVDSGSFWTSPAPRTPKNIEMQHIGHILRWSLWCPKGREHPNRCCTPIKHGVGIKRGSSKCEGCPQLPTSSCSWGINGLKAAPTLLALGTFTLGLALQGLDSWEGLVLSFLYAKRIFLLDRYTHFFFFPYKKKFVFPNTNPFQKNKRDLISQPHACNKSCLFSAFLRCTAILV